MLNKHFQLIVILFITISTTYGQRTNSIYLEALGSGLFYSVNTDFRFTKTTSFGGRLGIALYPENTAIIPVQVNYLIGQGRHNVELGAGITINISDETEIAECATLMYRLQCENGLLFRIGWSPTFIHTSEHNNYRDIRKIFWVWPGLSIGYSF